MLLNKKSLFIPLVLIICSCNTGYQPIQSKSIFIANDVDVRFAKLVHKRFFHEKIFYELILQSEHQHHLQ